MEKTIEVSDVSEDKIKELASIYKMDYNILREGDNYHALAVKLGFSNEQKREMGPTDLVRKIKEKGELEWEGKYFTSQANKNGQERYKLTTDGEKYICSKVKTPLNADAKQAEYNYWYVVEKGWRSCNNVTQDQDTFKKSIVEQYNKASKLRGLFVAQGKKDNIRQALYANIPYDTMFKNNENFGLLNICATLKVQGLQLVKEGKFLYLSTDEKFDGETEDKKYIVIKDIVVDVEESSKEGQATTEVGALSSTSQKVYILDNGKGQGIWNILKENYKDWFEPAKALSIEGADRDYLEDSFLTVTKQEYDELVYSNLFAYFFSKNPLFFNYFFKHIEWEDIEGKKKGKAFADWQIDKAEVDTSLSVEREKKNIDLFIKTNNKIIVIENKIKSGINGKECDDSNSETQNQLKKYHEYATKVAKEENLEPCFLIFAPNYNILDKKDFEGEEAKDYKIVRYDKIFNVCKAFKGTDGYKSFNGIDELYYKEFLKALYIHTDSSANNYYRQMQKRLLRIKNEQGNNK